MSRLARLLAAVLALALPGGGAAAETLTIGFRADTRPFSFRSAERPERFEGYLADLCTAIAEEAGFTVQAVEVGAADRFERIAAPGEGAIDLLCDPTTLTLDNARQWLFTPIVFVSGVSYLYSRKADDAQYAAAQEAAARLAAEVPAMQVPAAATADAEPPPFRVAACAETEAAGRIATIRVGYVSGTTAPRAIGRPEMRQLFRVPPGGTVCALELASHDAAIRGLCGGEFAYYFGDRDILIAQLAEHRAEFPDCDAVASNRFFSYEPYALVIGNPQHAVRIQAALYRLFSEGLPQELFARYFPGKEMSSVLRGLYGIQAVEPGVGAPAQ